MQSISSIDKKDIKNQLNSNIRSNPTSSNATMDHLQQLYHRTEAMKETATANSATIDSDFKSLKGRISETTDFLKQIKKSVNDIKVSYRRDMEQLEEVTEANRGDIDRQIEEIREYISGMRDNIPSRPEPQTYQEALADVYGALKDLPSGPK